MKKSNPRTSTPHLPFFSPLFSLFFHSMFLSFFSNFFLDFSSLTTCQNLKISQPYPIWGIPFKKGMKRWQGVLRGTNSWCSTFSYGEIILWWIKWHRRAFIQKHSSFSMLHKFPIFIWPMIIKKIDRNEEIGKSLKGEGLSIFLNAKKGGWHLCLAGEIWWHGGVLPHLKYFQVR